jgi:hypothetical protein
MNFIQRSDIQQMIDAGVFPGTVNWLMGDDQDCYQQNIVRNIFSSQMAAWRDKTINYTLNSQGFRAPEFDLVTWQDSVVVLGCSMVFGDGLDDSDTLCHQLSKIIARPVINLGVSAASAELIHYNSLILHPCQPWRVVVVWPSADRLTEFTEQGVRCHGIWQIPSQVKDYGDLATLTRWQQIYLAVNADTYHRDSVFKFHSLAVQTLWGHRAREFTWVPHTQKIAGCDLLPWPQSSALARDMIHPGPQLVRTWAEQIAESLRT